MSETRCKGTRKDGTPCASPPSSIRQETGYCWAHDPERAAERREARSKGGHASAASARLDRLVPSSLRPILGELIDALTEVHQGTLAATRATAMASLAGAIVRVYQVGIVDDRITAIEAELERINGGRMAVRR